MEDVLKFLDEEFKNKENITIVLGISGGPDSMALIDIFKNIKEKYNLNLICAHIHHNLRKESDKEKKDVEAYCKKNNIIFEWTKIESYGNDNLHNEGRLKRYSFFEEIIKKHSATYLVTAHHGDDLIETIMMRLVRGSTLKGYSGFQRVTEKSGYKIIRPLVYMTKEELIDYLEKNNIAYAIDKSNFDDEYTRNRYRKYVLPFLKTENQNVHLKFLKYSETLQEYSNFIDKIIEKEKKNVLKEKTLYLDEFNKLDNLIKTKIIYSLLEDTYNDDLFLVNDNHVNLIFDLIKSPKANAKVCLPNNVCLIKEYNKVFVSNFDSSQENFNIELEEMTYLPNGKQIQKLEQTEDNSNYTTRLNSKEVSLPLYVRNRLDGDKMKIKKLNGSKKINDIFIDSKISVEDRNLWPIVTDSKGSVVWVPGLKKSEFDKSKDGVYDIILYYF